MPSIFTHPGYKYEHKLQTVPNKDSYGKIEYPHFDIIELGEYKKHHLPPKVIHVNKRIVIKEPKPYPVKVPHHVPYPVIQKVPYPVINKEIVKVPEPIPYPVVKTIHVPVEVPKPYPVPSHEFEVPSPAIGNTGYEQSGYDQHGYDQTEYGNHVSGNNEIDPHQGDGNPLISEENTDHGPWKPLGVEQYQHLNEYIQHQITDGAHVPPQNFEERPVFENLQDS